MIGIYKITNPKNKIYIGQSTDIEIRFYHYKILHCKGQVKLYRSLIKYGFETHKFEIIEECDVERLNELERYWQDFYNVIDQDKGLNLRLTNTNDRSGKLSKETVDKMLLNRVGMTGKTHSEETREKLRNRISTKKGIKMSAEFGKKISEIRCKIVLNTENGVFHYSLKEVSETYGIIYSSLSAQLCGLKENKTRFIYAY